MTHDVPRMDPRLRCGMPPRHGGARAGHVPGACVLHVPDTWGYAMGMMQLTYEELAGRLGLSPRAARMRAKRRKGWTISTGNDGRARVSVDESELVAEGA